MIKSGEFDNLVLSNEKIPKIDTIRSSPKTVTLNHLRKINNSIIKKVVRNKVLDEGIITSKKIRYKHRIVQLLNTLCPKHYSIFLR